MFLRRKPVPFFQRLLNLIWPQIGWTRSFKYYTLRIKRIPGTPHDIAGGLACGAAISILPLVGLHFALSALSAYIMGVNITTAIIGTAFGNPWTFPLIWYASYWVGITMMGTYRPDSEIASINFIELFQNLSTAAIQLDLDKFISEVMPIWLPMMIGSIPMAVLTWFLTYMPIFNLIDSYQKHRKLIREQRRVKFNKNKNKFANIFKKLKRFIRVRFKKQKKDNKSRIKIRRTARKAIRFSRNNKHIPLKRLSEKTQRRVNSVCRRTFLKNGRRQKR